MLTHVPEGGKKLPDGFLERLAEATGKSQRELQYRCQFAKHYPSRDAIAQCIAERRSWFSITQDGLPERRNGMGVHYSSASDEWETPQDLFDALDSEFGFDLDVCALPSSAKCEHYFTPERDGLAQNWTGTCWMNPPYGDAIAAWVRKAWESSRLGATVVCLVPARVDTAWWWDYCRPAAWRSHARGRDEISDPRGRDRLVNMSSTQVPPLLAVVVERVEPSHHVLARAHRSRQGPARGLGAHSTPVEWRPPAPLRGVDNRAYRSGRTRPRSKRPTTNSRARHAHRRSAPYERVAQAASTSGAGSGRLSSSPSSTRRRAATRASRARWRSASSGFGPNSSESPRKPCRGQRPAPLAHVSRRSYAATRKSRLSEFGVRSSRPF